MLRTFSSSLCSCLYEQVYFLNPVLRGAINARCRIHRLPRPFGCLRPSGPARTESCFTIGSKGKAKL